MSTGFQLTPEMKEYFNKLVNLPEISNNQSAAAPSVNPVSQTQTPQTQNPLNSEVNNQLMQDFSNWRKQTENYPQPYDPKTGANSEYKPSKLRSILGDVAGTLIGISNKSPQKGFNTANIIKQQPYNQAMQRYTQSLNPYEQRMQQEAGLAGISAKNFYDFLRAQSSLNTSNAAIENAKFRTRLSTKPTVGVAHQVVKPGDTQATEEQPITSFNPETGQWGISQRTLGMGTNETPGERANLAEYRENQENQRALQGRLNQVELANIRELNDTDRLLISTASQLRGSLNPSEQSQVLNQVQMNHPNLFVWVDKTGKTYPNKVPNTTPVIKEGKQGDYQLALANETNKTLIQMNDPKVRILDLLEKNLGKKNPLIVGEKDVEK